MLCDKNMAYFKLLVTILAIAAHAGHVRAVPTLEDRLLCGQGDTPPDNRVDTTAVVAAVRAEMATANIEAYIVPMGDVHQSEYVSTHDARVRYVSGFSGSAGTAVIVDNALALWTDGRYFTQGDQELDCAWLFMKEGEPGVPTIEEWLLTVLSVNDRAGADDRIMTYDDWVSTTNSLDEIAFVSNSDVIDTTWDDQPPKENNDLFIHPIEYAGATIPEKYDAVLAVMAGAPVDVQLAPFSAMDEVAWFLNLRGSDVDFNPVFYSYLIVSTTGIKFYIQNFENLLTLEIRDHLEVNEDGSCRNTPNFPCITVLNYDQFYEDLERDASNLDNGAMVWISPMAGYALYAAAAVPQNGEHVYLKPSLIRTMKGRKNPTELAMLEECYKEDSAALIKFLAFLEKEIEAGNQWDELTAQNKLQEYREAIPNYVALSFNTISGFGPNGAVIHYAASEETLEEITTEGMYLLDSGGQYLGGTTDVTRTMHYGTPADVEKEAYTAVLQASIDLALTIWVNGTYGRDIDVVARAPLWALGLDYRHGTGHGIGMFLHVHEGPGRINIGYRETEHEEPLYGQMIFSDEPGYYEEGHFGIRLETVVQTVLADTKYNFGDADYLGFEELTLVPFEPKLINYEVLTVRQIEWLNAYNTRCRREIADVFLQDDADVDAYNWVMARTEPVNLMEGGASGLCSSFFVTVAVAFLSALHGKC